MLSQEDEEELRNFEVKVDEVMNILKLMSSEIKTESEEGLQKADRFLGAGPGTEDFNVDECIVKVTKDRTVINKSPAGGDTNDGPPYCSDTKAFMAEVEKDANRRHRERKEREKIAQGLRKTGNQAFSNGEFEKAVSAYSKAIDTVRDSPILYNNRALAYIRLELFKRAIIDCDFVLDKLDDKNLRAWLYRAKAYYALGEYRNYEKSIAEAKKLNPKEIRYIEQIVANIEGEKMMPESDGSSDSASEISEMGGAEGDQ